MSDYRDLPSKGGTQNDSGEEEHTLREKIDMDENQLQALMYQIEVLEQERDEMKALLESADNLLMQLEDVTHGQLEEEISKVRRIIQVTN